MLCACQVLYNIFFSYKYPHPQPKKGEKVMYMLKKIFKTIIYPRRIGSMYFIMLTVYPCYRQYVLHNADCVSVL